MEVPAPPHKLLTQWQTCLHTYIAMNRAQWWYCPMALWKESKTKWKQSNISFRVGPPPNRRSGVYTPWTAMTIRTKKLINKSSRSHPIKTHLDPVGKLLAVLANKGSLHCVLQVPEQKFCPCNDHYSYSQMSFPIIIIIIVIILIILTRKYLSRLWYRRRLFSC